MWKANKTNGELWRQKVSFKKLLVKRNLVQVERLIILHLPWLNMYLCKVCMQSSLTLIGMKEVTFHPLSFLDQILSAE